MKNLLEHFYMDKNTQLLIDLALNEDIGIGDITSNSIISSKQKAVSIILAKDKGIIAGIGIAEFILNKVDSDIMFNPFLVDGDRIDIGSKIAQIEGPARPLLTAERTILNFIQRLSGVATITNKFVEAVVDYPAKIVDTRKTTPGWRALEKYAVTVGGAANHRFGLYDAVLIKDNHINVAGSITNAVNLAKAQIPHTTKIEVETDNIKQVEEALRNHVDIIMLDNMTIDEMKKAVEIIDHKALVEASGGITLETVPQVAATGVDLISVGALTYSAMALDISIELEIG